MSELLQGFRLFFKQILHTIQTTTVCFQLENGYAALKVQISPLTGGAKKRELRIRISTSIYAQIISRGEVVFVTSYLHICFKLHCTLRLFLGEGWSSPLCIHVSSTFEVAGYSAVTPKLEHFRVTLARNNCICHIACKNSYDAKASNILIKHGGQPFSTRLPLLNVNRLVGLLSFFRMCSSGKKITTFGVVSSHLIKHMVKESMCFESRFLAIESVTEYRVIYQVLHRSRAKPLGH